MYSGCDQWLILISSFASISYYKVNLIVMEWGVIFQGIIYERGTMVIMVMTKHECICSLHRHISLHKLADDLFYSHGILTYLPVFDVNQLKTTFFYILVFIG